MAETETSKIEFDGGSIMFSPDVVETIAGIAALQVDGIAGMSGGFVDGIVQILGFKNFKKGVKAEIDGADANVTLSVVVDYDKNIQKVCANVQSVVKDALETMTGLNTASVNVNVAAVHFEDDKKNK